MIGRILVIPIAAICLLGCNPKDTGSGEEADTPETPREALLELIGYDEAGNFDGLIRTRYSEIAKAKTDAQVQTLVAQFSRRFGDKNALAQAIQTYKSALEIEPEISEDGPLAIYNLEQGTVVLSRMPNGMWGFLFSEAPTQTERALNPEPCRISSLSCSILVLMVAQCHS
jgi:hypothetical protein